MPVVMQGETGLSKEIVEKLWAKVQQLCGVVDEEVTVKVVSEEESRRLKREYRGQDKATNVLTFSYEGEHDIALCRAVAAREAEELGVEIRDYTAWLVVHAFLHAAGLDHEQSSQEADAMQKLEKKILEESDFKYEG
jgi:probable rRNA maturation factor